MTYATTLAFNIDLHKKDIIRIHTIFSIFYSSSDMGFPDLFKCKVLLSAPYNECNLVIFFFVKI